MPRVVLLVMCRKYDLLISKAYIWRKQICGNAGKAGEVEGWVEWMQQ